MLFVLYHIYKIYDYLRFSDREWWGGITSWGLDSFGMLMDHHQNLMQQHHDLMTGVKPVGKRVIRSLSSQLTKTKSELKHMQKLIDMQQSEINQAQKQLKLDKQYHKDNSPSIVKKEAELERFQYHLNLQLTELLNAQKENKTAQQKTQRLIY
jgi:hypothetical protein